MTKRVLFLSTVNPYGRDDGKKIVICGMLKYLESLYGKDNVYFVHLGVDNTSSNETGIYRSIVKPTVLIKIINVIFYSFALGAKSIQESLFYSKRVANSVTEVIREISPDLIIIDTIRIGQLFHERSDAKKILYMEDLFSVRYEAMLTDIVKSNIKFDPLGGFREHIPKLLVKHIIKYDFVTKYLLKMEKRLVTRSENNQPKFFDMCLLVNQNEVLHLKKRANVDNVELINPYLDLPDAMQPNRQEFDSCRYLFVGKLSVPHNSVAVMNLIKYVIPGLIERNMDVVIDVVGTGAKKNLKDAVKKTNGRIVLHGYVEDLRSFAEKSTAMIIPLSFGSGVKLKVIEALRYGLPIVATTFGVEGINVRDNRECFVENDFTKYPDIFATLSDREFNKAMSLQAQNRFAIDYSDTAISEQYGCIFNVDAVK